MTEIEQALPETAGRGQLSKAVQRAAERYLGCMITVRELRLLPYVDYCLLNGGVIQGSKINDEERRILRDWTERGLGEFVTALKPGRRFYDAMNALLWEAYVLPVQRQLEERS